MAFPLTAAGSNVRVALEFLRLAAGGEAAEAFRRHAASAFVHHNLHVEAGAEALRKAMEDSAREHPQTSLDVRHVVAEGDLVAVHSHVRHAPDAPGFAAVHLFRFADGEIVEFWDVVQEIPAAPPNAAGAF